MSPGKGEKTIELSVWGQRWRARPVEGKCVFKASVKRARSVDTCPHVKLNHIACHTSCCLTRNASRGKDVPSLLKQLKLDYTAF